LRRARHDRPPLDRHVTGRTTLGFILRRGDNVFEAFDRAERSLGVFKDQRSAADATSGEVAR